MNHAAVYKQALSDIPAPGQGCHPALLAAANHGVNAGVPPQEMYQDIRRNIQEGRRHVSDDEIWTAIRKAERDHSEFDKRQPASRAPEKIRFDAAAFRDKLIENADIDEADIWEASPVRIDWEPERDAAELLSRLYAPDDIVFIGDQYDRNTATVSDIIGKLDKGHPVPPHIIPNPLTGAEGLTKEGKLSYRSDACVKSFRYAVAEFDDLSRGEQLRFWWSIDMPIVALIDSGGKSLHAWIRIDDVRDAATWQRDVESRLFSEYLVPLGCDPACRNESRLSRLPGHFRDERKNWQRILFLAPAGRSICNGST